MRHRFLESLMSVVVNPSSRAEEAAVEFSVVVSTLGANPPLHLKTLLAAAQAMQPESRTFELVAVGPVGSAVAALESEVPFPYSYCHSIDGARAAARGRWLLELEDGTLLQRADLNFEVAAESSLCPPFTAHNIGLKNGLRTRPGQPPFEDCERMQAIGRIIDLAAATLDDGPLRIADLGALEMGFSVEAARKGHRVLALEGRQSNVDRFRWLEQHLDLPNLEVACDDVRNVSNHGAFDLVLCLGLLYHLDKPREVLEAIAAAVTHTLVLDTHVAIPNDPEAPGADALNEGLPGRWVSEFAPDTEQEDIDRLAWASLDNPASFWIQPKALSLLLNELGFPLVMRVHNVDDRPNRHFLVAIRDRSPTVS